jgi:hypothetical protein
MWTGARGFLPGCRCVLTAERSPSGVDVTQKLIDLQEFMFGFRFLFKCQDQHSPHYLLASALFSRFLERAKELEAAGFSKDLCVKCSSYRPPCAFLMHALQVQEAATEGAQRTQTSVLQIYAA